MRGSRRPRRPERRPFRLEHGKKESVGWLPINKRWGGHLARVAALENRADCNNYLGQLARIGRLVFCEFKNYAMMAGSFIKMSSYASNFSFMPAAVRFGSTAFSTGSQSSEYLMLDEQRERRREEIERRLAITRETLHYLARRPHGRGHDADVLTLLIRKSAEANAVLELLHD
jgi:hypothetical protein